MVFHAHYGCCQINDRKFFINDFLNGNLIIFLSGWIYFRIAVIYTIDCLGKINSICFNLYRTKYRCRIC